MAKFAFEISTEFFPATLAKFGFRENFALWVLDETIRLLSAVRFQQRIRKDGVVSQTQARMAPSPLMTDAVDKVGDDDLPLKYPPSGIRVSA
ncbi:MAG: hypothetical protein ACREC3_02730 [Methyloceanibacter sp.]